MNKNYVIGNWKMNGNCHQIDQFCHNLSQAKDAIKTANTEVIICPPAPYLQYFNQQLSDLPIAIGSQDVSAVANGARTSEISVTMLEDCLCQWVIVGHSERRQYCSETNDLVAAKVTNALHSSQLNVVLCIGETLQQREANQVMSVLEHQISCVIDGLNDNDLSRLIIAYEPVWAIGTGRAATAEMITEVHSKIKAYIKNNWQIDMPLLYGGSVNANNHQKILSVEAVNGTLVGGASLDSSQFSTIINFYQ